MNRSGRSRTLVAALIGGVCLTSVALVTWRLAEVDQRGIIQQAPGAESDNSGATAPQFKNNATGPVGKSAYTEAREPARGAEELPEPETSTDPARPGELTNLPFSIEHFQRRFVELATAGDWKGLETYLFRTLHKDAPDLRELWPILLAALEELGDQTGYDPIGRGVQTGLLTRKDLQECAGMLNSAFLDTSSPLVRVALAGPLTQANKGRDNTSLKLHIEKLLIYRDSAVLGSKPQNQSAYWDQLILGHTGLARSILDTIEFVESLRPGGLSDAKVRSFWSDCCPSAFYYRHYEPADVPKIIDYLITHTDESLAAASADDAAVRRLKLIWENFRELQAYESGLKHSQGLTDAKIQNAWDAILAHWLSRE